MSIVSWYDCIKRKNGDKAKLCYTEENSLTIHVKSKHVYADLAGDFEKRFGTSNYEVEIPIPIGRNQKVVGMTKDQFWWRDNERDCGCKIEGV